jgi:hypothetical protein
MSPRLLLAKESFSSAKGKAAIAELAETETRFAGGYPAFHNHIEPYLAVWTR